MSIEAPVLQLELDSAPFIPGTKAQGEQPHENLKAHCCK